MRRHTISRLTNVRPYLQFLAVLLMVAAGLFAWISVMGCDDCDSPDPNYSSPFTTTTSGPSARFRGQLRATADRGNSGDYAARTIAGQVLMQPAPDKVTFLENRIYAAAD